MINYPQELNQEQLNVVLQGDGPCLVLAGAGSGKTRTVTYRVAYLLEKGIDPKQILLVTFTNKAAKEMQDRVRQLTGGEVKLPWSGTFHHIAFRILKQYAPLLGYKQNFTILDSADSLDLLKLCLKAEGIDRKQKRFPSPNVVMGILSYARNAETTIVDVLDLKYPNWSDLADTLGRIAEEYRKRKLEANAMDFDDLLVNLYLLLLKSDTVRNRYAEQFQYVMVDEYQDTNKVQASIIRLLASKYKNILVVGDDAQSIYSFRAADIENILGFEREYPDAKIFRLETNYRSTPEILTVANEVIANNRAQYKKELRAVVKEFTKPEVHAFADQVEEAEFIAERILELREEGVPLKEIAVLFRAAFHSQALELELTRRDIPYDYRGGVRFFERAHIKDVLAYLKIYHNKDDSVAWSRVLNMQTGIGPTTAEKIIGAVRDLKVSLFAEEQSQVLDEGEEEPLGAKPVLIAIEELRHLGASLPARAQLGWGNFLQVWEELVKSDGTSGGIIRSLLESKYTEYLEYEYEDAKDRIQDIEQLAAFADRQPDLGRFLAEAIMQESYTKAQARSVEDDDEKMVLSTIHQAKGLEWEVVFIMNVSAGQFPSERSLREDKGIEEERRLFYVAVTRAKRHLYLSYPLAGNMMSMMQGPSMFLEEIDSDLIESHGGFDSFSGSSVFSDPSDDVDDIQYVSEEDEWEKKKRSFLSSVDDL